MRSPSLNTTYLYYQMNGLDFFCKSIDNNDHFLDNLFLWSFNNVYLVKFLNLVELGQLSKIINNSQTPKFVFKIDLYQQNRILFPKLVSFNLSFPSFVHLLQLNKMNKRIFRSFRWNCRNKYIIKEMKRILI